MDAKELLINALEYYNIGVIKEESSRVFIDRNYEVEIETSGLYKLFSDGQVIAPFDDIDELCRFVLL